MNVLKPLITVLLLPLVQIFLETSPVPVIKDTLEMEPHAQVTEVAKITEGCM